jgi:hypothetical protein
MAESLAKAWITDFYAANHTISWTAIEREVAVKIDDKTLLVGRVDAEGMTEDGEPFFGEWKTASASKARRMADEKAKWRRDPQALTYGVLLGDQTRRFTVRWALKTNPPQTDFEWYVYSDDELIHWGGQLREIARQIRSARHRGTQPWFTNVGNCYRHGVAYACPFVWTCPTQPNMQIGDARTPHLEIERTLDKSDPELVVLDASRVSDYLGCPEAYRRKWEGLGYSETSEALTIGSDFHALVAAHLKTLMKEKVNA